MVSRPLQIIIDRVVGGGYTRLKFLIRWDYQSRRLHPLKIKLKNSCIYILYFASFLTTPFCILLASCYIKLNVFAYTGVYGIKLLRDERRNSVDSGPRIDRLIVSENSAAQFDNITGRAKLVMSRTRRWRTLLLFFFFNHLCLTAKLLFYMFNWKKKKTLLFR